MFEGLGLELHAVFGLKNAAGRVNFISMIHRYLCRKNNSGVFLHGISTKLYNSSETQHATVKST
jgi:hypothetical protein